MMFAQNSPQYSWRYYRPGNTGIQGDYVTAVWVDENGDPYIAANTGNWGEGGIAKLDQAENKWVNYSNVDFPAMGSFDNGDIQLLDIVEDYNKNLWMGNFNGALKFSPETGASSFEQFGLSNSELLGYTTDIDLAPDSTLWFVSGGMVSYDPNDDLWTYREGANTRIAVQPKPDGSYVVWSADTYFGSVFIYNSATQQLTDYMPAVLGEVAGLPGKDCVDDVGNFWALRMSVDGNWETLEYQQPDGVWIYPDPPYENVSFYINAFKAYGAGKALLVTTTGETWMFDGTAWQNYGIWRDGDFTTSVDIDNEGNVWVCGSGGAAKRDVSTGTWQRYRITNTSQIDYFVEDMSIDTEGNVWMTGNAGTGVGGFQKFDGTNWTGFNEYTYGLGYPFPYQADNTQAIYSRPSNGDVVFNPTFNGIHSWDGENFFPLEDFLTSSEGFVEDSEGKLWSIGEYYSLRYYNDNTTVWTDVPIVGWGSKMIKDPTLPGTIWAVTDYELLRTDGSSSYPLYIEDIPGSAAWFTGFAVQDSFVWTGTWTQFTSTGSTLLRFNTNTGLYDTWEHDQGWPFPGEHVRPMTITPDGKLWMQYDSEYPSTDAGILWYDGETIETFPSSPGGIPQWGGLPNSNIKDLEVKEIPGGYELWMSCMGRGVAVLEVITDPVGISEPRYLNSEMTVSAYPNPAGEKVDIGFTMEQSGDVQLSVYDILGKQVRIILNRKLEKGPHTYNWDLTDQSRNRVIPGVYFVRFSNSGDSKSIKIIVQ
jgi:hypothetical protein